MATPCPPTKRRRRDLTLQEKQKIVIYMRQNPGLTRTKIASIFGIPRTTISDIACNADQITKSFNDGKISSSVKRLRKPTSPDVDTTLLEWFGRTRSCLPDFPISGEMLLEKANELASFSDGEIPISSSWINRWKARHSISTKKLVGEASSVNPAIVDEWINTKLPLLSKEFSPSDIFNADETGLFWRMLPDTTMALRKEQV